MKALVISGGGSLGAWGGGVAEYLFNTGNTYDVIVGTSTGALLSPMIAMNNFTELKSAYTSMNQNDIFNVNPFDSLGRINKWNAIWRILRGKKTLGETQKLREKIEKYLSTEEFDSVKKSPIDVACCVYNIQKRQSEYKSIKECSYDDYCDWMTASATVPIAMSTIEKNECSYVDGGVADHIPIKYLLNKNITSLDVIVHRTETYLETQGPINILDHFLKIIDALNIEISRDDIDLVKSYSIINNLTSRVFYLPYKFTTNSLLFDKDEMTKWWNIGANGGFNQVIYNKDTKLKKKLK
jgi:predicted patatin/cPLA2 family phospholipase